MSTDLNQTTKELRQVIILIRNLEMQKKRLVSKFQELVDYGIAENDGEPNRYSYDGLTIQKTFRRKKVYFDEVAEQIKNFEEAMKDARSKAEEFNLYTVEESAVWRCTATEDKK